MSLTQASPSQQWSEIASKTVTQSAGAVAIVDTGTWLILTPGGTATHQLTDPGDRRFRVVALASVVATDPTLGLVQIGGGPIVTYIAKPQAARRLYATAAAHAFAGAWKWYARTHPAATVSVSVPHIKHYRSASVAARTSATATIGKV